MLKAKIFNTINVNALTSKKKKNPNQPNIKEDIILFSFVFIGKWLHLNVFRNNNFEYL